MDGDNSNMDMCEYVFNPIMRNFQAMQRLLNMMRDSTQSSDCNDVECFSQNNPNPLINPNQSLFSSSWFLILIWGMFVFALFLLRPSNFRKKKTNANKKETAKRSNSSSSRSYYHDDDDDNSTVS